MFVTLFTLFALCMNANAGLSVDNCTASKTGHFSFKVEQAIGITVNDRGGEYGGICPGCRLTWPCGVAGPVIFFTITGGLDCHFNIKKENLVPFITDCISLEYFTYFLDEFGNWVILGTNDIPHNFLNDGNGGGIYYLKLQVCALEAKCCAKPGPYDFPVKVTVNYACIQ